MKASIRITQAIVLALAAGCAPGPDADAPAAATLTEAETERFTATGEAAAAALAQTLIENLQAALTEKGPVGAVEFCAVDGPALTAQVAATQGMTVKRTSFRVRNPANEPDALDAEALRRFEGSAPGSAGWLQTAATGEIRYYKPLYVQEFCLQCHGPATDLAPGIPQILAERYPGDAATGYAAGDFRGVIRVVLSRGDPDGD